jgi:hypothetical protein
MPRRPDDTEIIEVLDPDDLSIDWGVVRAAPASPPTRAEPRSRRHWPWVVVAVVAVVGVVVAIVITGNEAVPAPVTADGRYVLVDPRLSNYSTDVATPFDDSGGFRVWAVGGPDQPHVEIQIDTGATDPFIAFDGATRNVHGLDFISTLGRANRVTVVRDLGRDSRMVVRAAGLSDADVATIVNDTNIDTSAGRVADVVMPVGLERSLGLREVVSGRWQDEVLYGRVETTMRYLDEQSNVVTLRVARGSLFDQVTALGYLADRAASERGGRFAGQLTDTGDAVVLWQQDGYVLSLTGPGDPDRYVELSGAVRPATADEWDTQLMFLRPDYRVGDFALLGRGADWVAGVQRAERGGATKLLWWFSVPSEADTSTSVPVRFEPTVQPFADRIVVEGVTYVFVSAPAGSGVTDATVFFGDSGVEQLTLTQPFADIPVVMAAFRVDDQGSVRVMAPGVAGL